MTIQQFTFKEEIKDILESLRETGRRIDELSVKQAETTQQIRETDRIARRSEKKISELGSSIGRIIEHMVAGRKSIVHKFRALGYNVTRCSRNCYFEHPDTTLDIRGEIDLLLENGDIVILIEVKTTLEKSDVRKHMNQIEKFRYNADAAGDKRRFVGAVAGAVVEDDAVNVAHENGMYVIAQSGKAFEIVPQPNDFIVKKW